MTARCRRDGRLILGASVVAVAAYPALELLWLAILLRADNGTSYDAVENDNDLFGTVNAGNSMTGQLYFDLPSIHGELVYAPNYDGAPIAQWSF